MDQQYTQGPPVGAYEQQQAEIWRQYMADQADRQTRALNRIADNTSTTKVLAVVVLSILGLWILLQIIFGVTAASYF